MVLQEQFCAIAGILKYLTSLLWCHMVKQMGVAAGGFCLGVLITNPCWKGEEGMVALPACQVNRYHVHAATSSPVLAGKCLQPLLHFATYLLLDSALACVL